MVIQKDLQKRSSQNIIKKYHQKISTKKDRRKKIIEKRSSKKIIQKDHQK